MDGALRSLTAVTLGLALALLVGCETGPSKQALWTQNQELQDALSKERAARQAVEAERAAALARAASPTTRPAPSAPAAAEATPPAAGANLGANQGGFAGIEGVETIPGPGRVTVRVPGELLFASGSVDVRPTAQKTLDQIAAVLTKQYAANRIRIEGYTDTDPIVHSHWKDNLELSQQRAASVFRYLAKKGVDAKRTTVIGYGDTKPRATKAQSRRVEIVVLSQ